MSRHKAYAENKDSGVECLGRDSPLFAIPTRLLVIPAKAGIQVG